MTMKSNLRDRLPVFSFLFIAGFVSSLLIMTVIAEGALYNEPDVAQKVSSPEGAEFSSVSIEVPRESIDFAEGFKLVMSVVPPFEGFLGFKKIPEWRQHAVEVPANKLERPRIVVIIDDMGVSRTNSLEAIKLPGPLEMAFLPYAKDVAKMVKKARRAGHEIMVHMPMQPINSKLNAGPHVISRGMSAKEVVETLEKGLGVFGGYVGINNHMGSLVTQDKAVMSEVMKFLNKRGLLFVDSLTIKDSVAAATAEEYRVPYAVRHVFLDHDPSLAGVKRSLERLEKVAREKGVGIAIGHPKPNTIQALDEWLPSLEHKGFDLVPVSAVISVPDNKAKRVKPVVKPMHKPKPNIVPSSTDDGGGQEPVKQRAEWRLRLLQ